MCSLADLILSVFLSSLAAQGTPSHGSTRDHSTSAVLLATTLRTRSLEASRRHRPSKRSPGDVPRPDPNMRRVRDRIGPLFISPRDPVVPSQKGRLDPPGTHPKHLLRRYLDP